MSILIHYVWDPNFQNEFSSCSSNSSGLQETRVSRDSHVNINNNNINHNSNKLLNIEENNILNVNENDNKSTPNHLSASNFVKIFDNNKDTKEPSNWTLDELFKNKMDN